MKTPEKIYTSDNNGDTANCILASHDKDGIFDIEYIRSDIVKSEAEELAKEFAEWLTISPWHWSVQGWYKWENKGASQKIATINELFTEFINSRNK